MSDIKIIYDKEKLKRLIKDLHKLIGISISFLKFDGEMITEAVDNNDFCTAMQKSSAMRCRCENCDTTLVERCKQSKRFEGHICHQNLFDAALPIEKDGVFVGYVLMGRIRTENAMPNEHIIADSEMTELFYRLPLFSDEKLEALKALLPEILFANAITFEYDTVLENILNYIDENLTRHISVEELCNRFFLSRNALYTLFGEGTNSTVNKYITDLRLKRAKELLTDTEFTVETVARMTGFDNYAYFCRTFKRHTEKTPTEYRKTSQP